MIFKKFLCFLLATEGPMKTTSNVYLQVGEAMGDPVLGGEDWIPSYHPVVYKGQLAPGPYLISLMGESNFSFIPLFVSGCQEISQHMRNKKQQQQKPNMIWGEVIWVKQVVPFWTWVLGTSTGTQQTDKTPRVMCNLIIIIHNHHPSSSCVCVCVLKNISVFIYETRGFEGLCSHFKSTQYHWPNCLPLSGN